jgi:hypothetical protein
MKQVYALSGVLVCENVNTIRKQGLQQDKQTSGREPKG